MEDTGRNARRLARRIRMTVDQRAAPATGDQRVHHGAAGQPGTHDHRLARCGWVHDRAAPGRPARCKSGCMAGIEAGQRWRCRGRCRVGMSVSGTNPAAARSSISALGRHAAPAACSVASGAASRASTLPRRWRGGTAPMRKASISPTVSRATESIGPMAMCSCRRPASNSMRWRSRVAAGQRATSSFDHAVERIADQWLQLIARRHAGQDRDADQEAAAHRVAAPAARDGQEAYERTLVTIEDHEAPTPAPAPGQALGERSRRGVDQTRLRYSWVRVSISILSPVSTNSGTEISKPVASLAGFSTLPEVSPLTAGSV